jgi:hypothetical protein
VRTVVGQCVYLNTRCVLMVLLMAYYAETCGYVIINELVDIRSIWCLRSKLKRTYNRGWSNAIWRSVGMRPTNILRTSLDLKQHQLCDFPKESVGSLCQPFYNSHILVRSAIDANDSPVNLPSLSFTSTAIVSKSSSAHRSTDAMYFLTQMNTPRPRVFLSHLKAV